MFTITSFIISNPKWLLFVSQMYFKIGYVLTCWVSQRTVAQLLRPFHKHMTFVIRNLTPLSPCHHPPIAIHFYHVITFVPGYAAAVTNSISILLLLKCHCFSFSFMLSSNHWYLFLFKKNTYPRTFVLSLAILWSSYRI